MSAGPHDVTARQPVTVVLLGEPVPFARMRIASRSGAHFVPAQQRNAAALLKLAAGQAMQEQNAALFDEPLSLHLLAEFSVPASWSKKRRNGAILGEIRPGKRPDIDNLYKLAADALSGVVYRDDALIVDCWMRKIYGNQPKLVVTVQPVSAELKPKPRANAAWRPGELPLVVAA